MRQKEAYNQSLQTIKLVQWTNGLVWQYRRKVFCCPKKGQNDCTKLYKERLLLGLQYIPIAGQGIMDSRTTGTITTSFYVNSVHPISKAHTQRIERIKAASEVKNCEKYVWYNSRFTSLLHIFIKTTFTSSHLLGEYIV